MKKKYILVGTLLCLICLSGSISAKSGHYKYKSVDDDEFRLSEECYTQKDNNKKDRAFCRVAGAEKAVEYYINISKTEYQDLKENESEITPIDIFMICFLALLVSFCFASSL